MGSIYREMAASHLRLAKAARYADVQEYYAERAAYWAERARRVEDLARRARPQTGPRVIPSTAA